jgi:hypothetical protein
MMNKHIKNIEAKPPINCGNHRTGKLLYSADGSLVPSWVTMASVKFWDRSFQPPRSTYKGEKVGERNGGELGDSFRWGDLGIVC